MTKLAIKGHALRGKEVIGILEMLGGKSNGNIKGYNDDLYYYIAKDGLIYGSGVKYDELARDYTIFSLEEFLERYPYKVGDEVEYKSIGDANLKSKIIYMEWCNSLNKVLYTTEDAQVISTEDITETKSIPPYKEEIMEENVCENISGIDDDAIFRFNYSMRPEVNADGMLCYKIPEGYETFSVQNGMIILKPKKPTYPKTYKECCDVLGINTMDNDAQGYKADLIIRFQELFIARNAYWKIAGEQMGLGKPWEPDLENEELYCIENYNKQIIKSKTNTAFNKILIFPTEEMRDAFYDNFKDLIESCKELL